MRINPRLLTAVHEAGHAVVAYRLGLRVRSIQIHNVFCGETDVTDDDRVPTPHEDFARVAVAGFAGVGVCLGAEAEAESRASDDHEEEGSDLLAAIEHARGAGVADEDLHCFLSEKEAEVRALLSIPATERAVGLVAERLADGLDRMSGDHIAELVMQAEREHS